MMTSTRKQFKILNTIVSDTSIDMMYNLFSCQIPSKVFFHDKTMFSNIFTINSIRVIRTINHYISRMMFCSASFPSVAFRAFKSFTSFPVAFFRLFCTSFCPFILTRMRTSIAASFKMARSIFNRFSTNFARLFHESIIPCIPTYCKGDL